MVTGARRNIDRWGRVISEGDDVFELFYRGAIPSEITCNPSSSVEAYNKLCLSWDKPDERIAEPVPLVISPEDEEKRRASEWQIPDQFIDLDVRSELISRCENDIQRDRVNMELDIFESREQLPLLRLMFSLVDHWRKNNVVWGVGRGSSVASYCLYLIGVHRIDPIKYDLSIEEFLK